MGVYDEALAEMEASDFIAETLELEAMANGADVVLDEE